MTMNLNDRRAGLPPPRFSLASLLGVMAGFGVLFAAMIYLGSYATLLLILFALAVIAHVAGNALGTRLRDNGNRPLAAEDGSPAESPDWQQAGDSDFAPATRLRERAALGKPTLIVTVAGVVLGGGIGGYGLILLMEQITIGTACLAIVASAVLGGFWTFLAASLCQVAAGAAWHAMRQADNRGRSRDESS